MILIMDYCLVFPLFQEDKSNYLLFLSWKSIHLTKVQDICIIIDFFQDTAPWTI